MCHYSLASRELCQVQLPRNSAKLMPPINTSLNLAIESQRVELAAKTPTVIFTASASETESLLPIRDDRRIALTNLEVNAGSAAVRRVLQEMVEEHATDSVAPEFGRDC